MVPKRVNKKVRYLTSKAYKDELRAKYAKWSHVKAATVYYTRFTRAYNPYAKDWFYLPRTKTMQKRADAMFDSMITMLRIRMEKVPSKTKKIAIRKALFMWAEKQQSVDGRKYLVFEDTIKPIHV